MTSWCVSGLLRQAGFFMRISILFTRKYPIAVDKVSIPWARVQHDSPGAASILSAVHGSDMSDGILFALKYSVAIWNDKRPENKKVECERTKLCTGMVSLEDVRIGYESSTGFVWRIPLDIYSLPSHKSMTWPHRAKSLRSDDWGLDPTSCYFFQSRRAERIKKMALGAK